jgi:MYXO-CTERM domain-containing protein
MKISYKICPLLSLAFVGSIFASSTAHAQSLDRASLSGIDNTAPSGIVLPAFMSQRVTPGRDRFLNEPVLTTDALVEALKTNKTFRRNISKHFGLPEDRVVGFVEDALVPYILPKDTTVSNYGVTRAGMIYSKKMTLKKGTRVWATRDGSPILKWICSNPLLPKAPVLKKKPKPSTVSSTRVPTGLQQVAANITDPLGLDVASGGDLGLNTPAEPPVPRIVVREPGIDPKVPLVPPAVPPKAVPGILRTGLPLLPIAGVAGAIVRSVKQPESKETLELNLEPQALDTHTIGVSRVVGGSVPEPGTLALAALGLAGLPLLRRRK